MQFLYGLEEHIERTKEAQLLDLAWAVPDLLLPDVKDLVRVNNHFASGCQFELFLPSPLQTVLLWNDVLQNNSSDVTLLCSDVFPIITYRILQVSRMSQICEPYQTPFFYGGQVITPCKELVVGPHKTSHNLTTRYTTFYGWTN